MREDAVASEGAEPADGEEVTPSSFTPLLAGSADAPALRQVDPETARKREITEAFWAECLAEVRELFGGDERIAALKQFIHALSERGFTLVILSFGHEAEVRAALHWIGLETYFKAVYGNESYKGPKRNMLLNFRRSGFGECFFVVDDDRANYPDNCSTNFTRYVYIDPAGKQGEDGDCTPVWYPKPTLLDDAGLCQSGDCRPIAP